MKQLSRRPSKIRPVPFSQMRVPPALTHSLPDRVTGKGGKSYGFTSISELRVFIDRVVIPALLERFLQESAAKPTGQAPTAA